MGRRAVLIAGVVLAAACNLVTGAGDLVVASGDLPGDASPAAADGSSSTPGSAPKDAGGTSMPTDPEGGSSVADAGKDAAAPDLLGCNAAGLLAMWRLDEGSGSTVADCTGHGYDGALTGGTHWDTGRPGHAAAVGFEISGGEKIALAKAVDLPYASPFTVALWANVDPDDTGGTILGRGTNTKHGWRFGYDSPSNATALTFTMTADADFDPPPDSPPVDQVDPFPLTRGAWLHLAITFQPKGALQLWVNGALVSTGAGPSATPPAGDLDTLGYVSYGDNTQFSGSMQSVRIFSRALAPAEVMALANEP